MRVKPFARYEHNPILTPRDIPFDVDAVLNPGLAVVGNEILLLLRIEDTRGISAIYVARSANGVDGWRIEKEPLLRPGLPDHPLEEWGCEDARVTQIDDRRWVIAYTAYSRYGASVALAETEDFASVKRLGTVLAPTNKDAAVFPERVEGRWVLLHRPVTGAGEHIWYAQSDGDLTQWTSPGLLLDARGGPYWDGLRVGVGAPPIETDRGWLLIYHGVKEMAGRPVYRLGLALLGRNDPRQVIARCNGWLFAPEADYEQHGLVPGVVYTCGALPLDDQIWMYYGAADTSIALAVAKTDELMDFLEEHGSAGRQ